MHRVPWFSAPAGAARVLSGTEGRILFVGAALSVLMMLALGVAWLLAPGPTTMFSAMLGLDFLLGIAAGISFGYANGLDDAAIVGAGLIADTLQVLIAYPLFVLSWQHLLDIGRLRPYLERLQVSAEAQQGWARRFGIAGLFLFVFVPFWMTGPVIGSIIGFLIGLRPLVNLAVVLSATYLTTVFWAFTISEVNHRTAAVDRYALFATIVAVALLALVWRVLSRRR
jgi:uncharacterized membrane protein